MKYLLTLCGTTSPGAPTRPPSRSQESMKRWDAYTIETKDAGAFLGGEGLQPTATATTVQIEPSGDHIVTDGPFAETKEQLGGFYLLECENLDEAIAWAQEDPDAGRQGRGPAGDGLRGRRLGRAHAGSGSAAVGAPDEAVDRLFREESGRAVAALIRVLGDFDLAEEAVQDAFLVALEVWPERGVPRNPGAWITTTARNKAIDRIRRARRLEDKVRELEALAARGARRTRSTTAPSPTTGCG